MPAWNLLILPLIAGYIFLTNCYYFKFRQQRLEQQRLVFQSLMLAIGLGFLTYTLRLFLEQFTFTKNLISEIYRFIPLKIPHIGTSLATIIISIAITVIFNLIDNKPKRICTAIKSIGNELEKILLSALEKKCLLQFTLNNGKYYVGWVLTPPIPSNHNYVRFVPALGGYIDDNNKTMQLTTIYLSILDKLIIKLLQDDVEKHAKTISWKDRINIFRKKTEFNQQFIAGKKEEISKKKLTEDDRFKNLSRLNIDIVVPLDKITSVSFYTHSMFEELSFTEEATKEQNDKKSENQVCDNNAEESEETSNEPKVALKTVSNNSTKRNRRKKKGKKGNR